MEIYAMTKVKLSLLSVFMLQITAIVTPVFAQEVTQDRGAYALSSHKADLESESASSPPRKVIVETVPLPMPWRQFLPILGPQETRLQLDPGLHRRATTSRVRSMCLRRLPLSRNSLKKKTRESIVS
jgi:hypothetical protein